MIGRFVSVSVTSAGEAMAMRLPFERVHGGAGRAVAGLWDEVDGLVLFLATGAAVRIVAPLLDDKAHDPGVVCVDEAGRYAVALCGGHTGRANELAREVASLLGAEAVVTTATDATGRAALDHLPGFTAVGDVAGVTTALLDGRPVELVDEMGWPVPDLGPDVVVGSSGASIAAARIIVTDCRMPTLPGTVVLHPPSLVVGVGASSDAPADQVTTLVDRVLTAHALALASVAEVATITSRATHPGVLALGRPVRAFAAERLADIDVPSPSDVVRAAVGTPSVAEAAALLAGGPGSRLIVPKSRNEVATVAVARRAAPQGSLALVGLGPGGALTRTQQASAAVRAAEVVIGYGPYLDQCADLHHAGQEVVRSPIGEEVDRARDALARAAAGQRVALVCSGDAGVYAMASIALELAEEVAPHVDVVVVPGVTAALAASAVLGAPLGHDHVSISLSDLLTPWEVIERRLRAAGESDLVVCLYNPRSRGRTWQLGEAGKILLEFRPSTTPVGVVTDAGREDEHVGIIDLGSLDVSLVGMTTCVIIGASTTRLVHGRMVTPRGYQR